MFEQKSEPLASRKVFFRRVAKSFLTGILVLSAVLLLGMAGFHEFVHIESWTESFLNAAMLVGGMGPIDDFQKSGDSGKVFAGLYALFCGLVFLSVFTFMISPVVHRLLHKFHIENKTDQTL
jgi:hypothetical protein